MNAIFHSCMLIKRIFNKIDNILFILKLQIRINGAKKIICQGHKNIKIGRDISIGRNSWLAAVPLTGLEECSLIIEDDCYIGNNAHFYATHSIKICKKTLIADKVYISDNLHGYENINLPIIDQPILQKNPVVIGEESWIGENVCIIGANVGKHCVIGANSVVTCDIPSYSVAVGSPAKVIKYYDFSIKKWVRK